MNDDFLQIQSDDAVDEQAVAWFIKLRGNDVTAADWAHFDRWVSQSESRRQAFNELCEMWGDPDLIKVLEHGTEEKHRQPQRKENRLSRNLKIPLLMAACLALLFPFYKQCQIWLYADFVSALGERKTVHLEDGTTVMLNTDSAIDIEYENRLRKVVLLKGEAFFDVQPDVSRPFSVQAGHSYTKVLGTRFFVQREHGLDEVRVLSGRVEVSQLADSKISAVIHDKDTLIVDDSGLGQAVQLASNLPVSWINGYLTFEEENLSDVIKQIYRYRHGFVFFENPDLRNLKINGRLSLTEPEDMLRVLQTTLDIKITFYSDWLVIIG